MNLKKNNNIMLEYMYEWDVNLQRSSLCRTRNNDYKDPDSTEEENL